MRNNGKILAVDFGEKTVGLAISDQGQTMVFGRGVIRDFKRLTGLFEQIKALCESEAVIEVVMGLPVGEDGEDTRQTARIRSIGEKLEEYLGSVPVVFEDESFTSFEADEFLTGVARVRAKNRKETEDEMAAVLILKRYLDLEAN